MREMRGRKTRRCSLLFRLDPGCFPVFYGKQGCFPVGRCAPGGFRIFFVPNFHPPEIPCSGCQCRPGVGLQHRGVGVFFTGIPDGFSRGKSLIGGNLYLPGALLPASAFFGICLPTETGHKGIQPDGIAAVFAAEVCYIKILGAKAEKRKAKEREEECFLHGCR